MVRGVEYGLEDGFVDIDGVCEGEEMAFNEDGDIEDGYCDGDCFRNGLGAFSADDVIRTVGRGARERERLCNGGRGERPDEEIRGDGCNQGDSFDEKFLHRGVVFHGDVRIFCRKCAQQKGRDSDSPKVSAK